MGTAITLTLDGLKALDPCDFAKRKKFFAGDAAITAAEARAAGASFDDIVWVASALARRDANVERRVRLWLADCAARVLHIYEKEAPTDARVRAAVIASRQFARGEITAAARDAARAAARDAARAAAWDAEEHWQFSRICAWLSADEPEDWPLGEIATAKAA